MDKGLFCSLVSFVDEFCIVPGTMSLPNPRIRCATEFDSFEDIGAIEVLLLLLLLLIVEIS